MHNRLIKQINTIAILAVHMVLCVTQLAAASSFQGELDRLFNSGKSKAQWSIYVEDIDTGKGVYSLYPGRKLVPASNMKVPVCAGLLLQVSPEYQYDTSVYLCGKQEGDVFQGDLIVSGSGDPSIDGRYKSGDKISIFKEWAEALKSRKINKITGRVIGIDEIFDDVRRGLNWDQQDFVEWYAAEISGLSFNDACIDILIAGAEKPGEKASISLDPNTQYLQVENNVSTVGGKQAERGVGVKRKDGSTVLELAGSVKAKSRAQVFVTVPDPAKYFVTVLKETLQAQGITIEGNSFKSSEIKEIPPKEQWQKVSTYLSPPLKDLLSTCLKNSQNLYAEHFLKTLGAIEYGVGTYETGALAIKDVMFKNGCKLDNQYIADGSGLSRENQMSAKSFVSILRTVLHSPSADIFFNALPVAGDDGTLRNRMRGTAAQGKVFAKTGSMKGVSALSGLIEAKSGKKYLFSMIGNSLKNGIRLSEVIDDACVVIASNG